MPLVHFDDLLDHARSRGYGVAAFEATPLFLEAVLAAARDLQAPLVLTTGGRRGSGRAPGALWLPTLAQAAQAAPGPVAVHYRGATSEEEASRAIALGANSVTVDTAGPSPFPSAAARKAVELIKACGACAGITLPRETADPQRALALTGASFLALGSLEEGLPAGLAAPGQAPLWAEADGEGSDEGWEGFFAAGLATVEGSLLLSRAAAERVLQNAACGAPGDYEALLAGVEEAVRVRAAAFMESLGGRGQAGEALGRCRLWKEVEHLVLYNVDPKLSPEEAQAMVSEGCRTLARVPGVRRVAAGRAVGDAARYRYCWLVRFAGRPVISRYRDHPLHQAFADGRFRPVAADRLTTDYEIEDQAVTFDLDSPPAGTGRIGGGPGGGLQ